jgi:S-adenosylmethionine:tRNA ribosyltransferase-isomerase
MNLKDFWYDLPERLIAQDPIEKRDFSRLLVLDRKTGTITHKHFYDITRYLEPGDCLVLNNTRVLPARLLGVKEGTGGKIEFVILRRIDKDDWEVILKPGRKAKPGARFVFGDGILTAEILKVVEDGNRIVRFHYQGIFEEILDKVGIIPLPPYIHKELKEKERYQTVYSKIDGSAAAPTAGLHFTPELLNAIREKGVKIAEITLHVGLGTFRPVKTQNISEHRMHKETYNINPQACAEINKTRESGKRIIAVGTTSVRVLETSSSDDGVILPGSGETDIFIYPGYKFKIVDALITNFHLPESTLIMLVSAFAGKDKIMEAYKEAISKEYRFFSFGDAMLIL